MSDLTASSAAGPQPYAHFPFMDPELWMSLPHEAIQQVRAACGREMPLPPAEQLVPMPATFPEMFAGAVEAAEPLETAGVPVKRFFEGALSAGIAPDVQVEALRAMTGGEIGQAVNLSEEQLDRLLEALVVNGLAGPLLHPEAEAVAMPSESESLQPAPTDYAEWFAAATDREPSPDEEAVADRMAAGQPQHVRTNIAIKSYFEKCRSAGIDDQTATLHLRKGMKGRLRRLNRASSGAVRAVGEQVCSSAAEATATQSGDASAT